MTSPVRARPLARYVDEGKRVMVVTLTGGERGDILNPAMDLPEVRGRIADIRRDEMAKAAEILGVEHRWLGSSTPAFPRATRCRRCPGLFRAGAAGGVGRRTGEGDPRVPSARDDHLRRKRGYPHPDHIRCHQVSVAAYEAAADDRLHPEAGPAWAVSKLYYNHGFAEAAADLAGRVRPARTGGGRSPAGWSTGTPTRTCSPTG